MDGEQNQPRVGWLNPTLLGIELASPASDWSYEVATTVADAFLGTMTDAPSTP